MPFFTSLEVVDCMDASVKQAGIILLVTGGGGALGMVLRDSGAGDHVAKLINSSNNTGCAHICIRPHLTYFAFSSARMLLSA